MGFLNKLLLVSACTALAIVSCSHDPLIFTDPDETVEVPVGGEFVIALVSNPSTGYQWFIVEPTDATRLELVDHEFQASNSGMEGAPGTELWQFRALARGVTNLILEYRLSWDSASVIRTADFHVDIQ